MNALSDDKAFFTIYIINNTKYCTKYRDVVYAKCNKDNKRPPISLTNPVVF